MGSHAFTGMPAQAARLQCNYPEVVNEGLFGVVQGWDVPFALWRARDGFDAYYPGNAHNTLSFVVSGASVERLDGRFAGRRGRADADSFMLYADGGSRRYASRGDVRLCQIYFQTSLIQNIASMESDRSLDGLELCDDRIFARDLELRRMMENYVFRALDAVAPPSLLEIEARATLLGVHLLHHHSNRADSGQSATGSLSPRRLATVFDYVEAHLAENVSLAELANAVNLSRHHFCTSFRRSTGMTPHRYVIARRIERAKLLLAGPAPLAQIALDCGFASQQHFTTALRLTLGTTPGALRASTRH